MCRRLPKILILRSARGARGWNPASPEQGVECRGYTCLDGRPDFDCNVCLLFCYADVLNGKSAGSW
jgi:hypothetical protein